MVWLYDTIYTIVHIISIYSQSVFMPTSSLYKANQTNSFSQALQITPMYCMYMYCMWIYPHQQTGRNLFIVHVEINFDILFLITTRYPFWVFLYVHTHTHTSSWIPCGFGIAKWNLVYEQWEMDLWMTWEAEARDYSTGCNVISEMDKRSHQTNKQNIQTKKKKKKLRSQIFVHWIRMIWYEMYICRQNNDFYYMENLTATVSLQCHLLK